MKRYALMATLALFLGNTAQAAVIDLVPGDDTSTLPPSRPVHDLAVTPHTHIVTPPFHLAGLPEPEVFAMILVGLVLIGYRASPDSSDKFK